MRVGVFGLVTGKNEQNETTYLLMSSKKDYGQYTGFYYPPGGGVEEGETTEQALIREFQEELAMHVQPIKELVVSEGGIPDNEIHWFLCESDSPQFTISDPEVQDAGFFTKDQIDSMDIWPATARILKEYIFNEG